MTTKKILIVGGDLRIIYLAELFKKNGFNISVFGIDQNTPHLTIVPKNELSSACTDADIIVLPLPVSKDANHINAPFYSRVITTSELVDNLCEKHTVIAGKLEPVMMRALELKGIKYCDYFKDESLTLKNAQITAEGAIMLAIQKTALSLADSRCLVIGYGRIAKFLSRTLITMGAKVVVAARRKEVLTEAELSGCTACYINEIPALIGDCDIVFNTVPATVLDEKSLVCLKENVPVIDLASKPGGVDLNAADVLSVNLVPALSIPGKVAPRSAARIIFKTICSYLNDTNF